MFETETVGPFLVQNFSWGWSWLPWPPNGYAPKSKSKKSQAIAYRDESLFKTGPYRRSRVRGNDH